MPYYKQNFRILWGFENYFSAVSVDHEEARPTKRKINAFVLEECCCFLSLRYIHYNHNKTLSQDLLLT